ncbi:Peptidyl-prolyl cis-trans isomerase CWC27 [Tetrabaena socialis]|uniref:Peptidyl-prolyl cis-trans isomerase CWC27 n=1 Tax=Tetrabaena socialis TaxID=47790 RepID=A0A2J7ZYI2_9CHLO|nr:Peptidyl-prolyl cis-trans isomerase CWC27 [Tetrabaena socialis]|eukprot:PNH05318.1 Peptidyl-prolyl cis-trans isomerase CWC27 [Tetrabaena socialis]
MSNIYNLEPPTKGKVILHTSLGDLEIELWPKEAPKVCRAKGSVRGESIYGEAFKDEFHSRLRFTRRIPRAALLPGRERLCGVAAAGTVGPRRTPGARLRGWAPGAELRGGLVACANQNEPNSNGAQFFFTLDKADWLNNRNTIFGRIVGDTVYNMLRFNELPLARSSPLPRVRPRPTPSTMAADARKRAAGRTKNLALLSFGEEAEEEEAHASAAAAAAKRSKIRSAHDVLEDDRGPIFT